MIKGIFYKIPPSRKFFIALFFILTSFFVMYIIGILFVQVGFKVNIISNPEILNDLNNKTSVNVLKFFQLILSIGLFTIPPFIIGYFFYYSVSDFLRLKKMPIPYYIILSIIAVISFIPFTNFLSYMNNLIHLPTWLNKVEQWMQTSENNANKLTVLFLEAHSLPELLYNIFLIALVPSVGEELLFRGVFQRIFTEWFKNYHLGIWISAILFSLIHFQFYGFLSRLFLGASFGYLLEITKNMWLPILTHFVNNLVGVLIAYFISPEKMINTNFYNFSFIEFIYAILGLLVGIACFWLIAKKAKRIL